MIFSYLLVVFLLYRHVMQQLVFLSFIKSACLQRAVKFLCFYLPNMQFRKVLVNVFCLSIVHRWWCHFDDDNYVNVPRLLSKLQEFDPQEDWYLGRISVDKPVTLFVLPKETKKKVSTYPSRLRFPVICKILSINPLAIVKY